MKAFGVLLAVVAIGVAPAANGAARQLALRSVRSATVAQPAGVALTVTPFAVPVAVPVTVISQPAVLYSYRQYAMPARGSGGVDAPAVTVPSTSAPGELAPASDAPAIESTVALLTARCAKCHTGEAPAGHLQIFDAAGKIVPRLPRRAIVEMASPDDAGRQRMPPGDSPKLNAEELATLREWARPPRDLAY